MGISLSGVTLSGRTTLHVDQPDPYFANVSLLLHGNGTNGSTTIIDSSSNNFTMTVSGTPSTASISTAQYEFGNASINFPGNSNNGVTTPSNSKFNFGTTDNFTMEMFCRPSTTSSVPTFLSNYTAWDTGGFSITYNRTLAPAANNKFVVYAYNYSLSLPMMTSANTFSSNIWYHVALTRDGSVFRLFVDGNLEGSVTSAVSFTSSRNLLYFGHAEIGNYFTGYLDEIRITKGVARYTSNFTPPTGPFS